MIWCSVSDGVDAPSDGPSSTGMRPSATNPSWRDPPVGILALSAPYWSPCVDHQQQHPRVFAFGGSFAMGDKEIAGQSDQVIAVPGDIGDHRAGLSNTVGGHGAGKWQDIIMAAPALCAPDAPVPARRSSPAPLRAGRAPFALCVCMEARPAVPPIWRVCPT